MGRRLTEDPWEKRFGDTCNGFFISSLVQVVQHFRSFAWFFVEMHDPWQLETLDADAVFPEIMRLAVSVSQSQQMLRSLGTKRAFSRIFSYQIVFCHLLLSRDQAPSCVVLHESLDFEFEHGKALMTILIVGIWVWKLTLSNWTGCSSPALPVCSKKQCGCNKDFKLVVWPLQTEAHLISAQIFFFAATRLDYEDGNWSLNSTRKIHHETSLVDGQAWGLIWRHENEQTYLMT